VRDHDGQQLAYVYFEDEPGRRLAYRPARHAVSRQRVAAFRLIRLLDIPKLFESSAASPVAIFPIPPRARRILDSC